MRAAVTDRRGYVVWDVAAIGCRVGLPWPEWESFRGGTPEAALVWCLIWLMVEALGIGTVA